MSELTREELIRSLKDSIGRVEQSSSESESAYWVGMVAMITAELFLVDEETRAKSK